MKYSELDAVCIPEGFYHEDTGHIPGTAVGTVVGVWRGGLSLEVEFTHPVQAVVTVGAMRVRLAPHVFATGCNIPVDKKTDMP